MGEMLFYIVMLAIGGFNLANAVGGPSEPWLTVMATVQVFLFSFLIYNLHNKALEKLNRKKML
jgi:hypothetical protein